MFFIRQGATHKVRLGPAVAIADSLTPVTNLDVASADEAEVILHDNATVVDISGYTWVAIATADGYYHLTLQAAISGTVGHMTVVVQDDDLCLPLREDFTVLEEAAYDAMYKAAAPGPVTIATVLAGTTTFVEALRGFIAVLLGKASGLAGTTAVYRDIADSMPVVTATVDEDGNRSAVTLDLDDTP